MRRMGKKSFVEQILEKNLYEYLKKIGSAYGKEWKSHHPTCSIVKIQ